MDRRPEAMPRKRDDDTGRYTERYPLDAFREAIEAIGPASTSEIGDHVGCDRRTAYLKMGTLEDEGHVTSRKIGQARLWSVAAETDN